jgi:elongation factor Ts
MTNIEQVKKVREITLAPINKINKALAETNGDVDKAIEILVKQREASVEDMANRKADSSFVYSYVHNNKVGAMIVLASQTDFVAKNELFTQLAKDICMHIVSSPIQAQYVDEQSVNEARRGIVMEELFKQSENKPQAIRDKIVKGKMDKWYSEICLLNQKFVKDDTITIKELITKVSGIVGEKIEIKQFVRLSA